jgi:UDP-N-acetyl-D-mannosaminuronic acid dehydrogenase
MTTVGIVGGAGHVGLPLAIALASAGLRVRIVDTSAAAVGTVTSGRLPFREDGAADLLAKALDNGSLSASTDAAALDGCDTVVVVIGTPVDEHLNPDPTDITRVIGQIVDHLVDGQLLVLRSTVFPGVTARVAERLRDRGLEIDVAYCPERIAQGNAMTELYTLPQIVSGETPRAAERAEQLFRSVTDTVVVLTPEEAELAKLFTNAWRYIKFAASNQFFMIANSRGLDFERIRSALSLEYPRAADMPRAGFAAGPCLFKDTMQLAAVEENRFALGHAAMLVNEGLPFYVVSSMERRMPVRDMTIGILGMAFKGDSDDTRESLSYKLKRVLTFRAAAVLTTDPHVTTDPDLLPLQDVLDRADALIIATPHSEYRSLSIDKPVADIWSILGRGVMV